MMRFHVLFALIGLCAFATRAQQYEFTGFFVYNADTITSIDAAGSNSYTFVAPMFEQITGFAYNESTDRVYIMARETDASRIVSISSSLDPSTLQTHVSGIVVDATGLDVDPASGRLFWWGGGAIRSADPVIGIPGFVSTHTAPSASLRIDTDRGTYVSLLDISVVGTGLLDSFVQPVSFNTLTGGLILDIAIDQITGDFLWTEVDIDIMAQTINSSVVRSANDFQNASVVYTVPEVANAYGTFVVGDQIALTVFDGLDTRVRVYDQTSGETSGFGNPIPGIWLGLEAKYSTNTVAQQPTGVLIDEGQAASLSVLAYDPGSTYQWLRDGVPLVDDGRVSNSTGATLTIDPAEALDSDGYACAVTDGSGNTQTSELALLVVRGSAPCPADVNNDGMATPADFTAWLAAFNIGCP